MESKFFNHFPIENMYVSQPYIDELESRKHEKTRTITFKIERDLVGPLTE